MLAAMYSETGNFSQAVLTAQQALEIAEKQQNAELTSALRANLARYQHQALSGPSAQN
jgi:hypothetical protein